jgi:nucleoside-diphosphate-sugar epimerase
MPASPTAFVTGGTGFIGSHLVEQLLVDGYEEVRCLIRRDPKWLRGMNIVPVPGTLENRETLVRGCADADIVYHIAGVTRAPTWETFHKANIEGTRRLLDVLTAIDAPPRRTVVTSSLAVIGTGTVGMADESTPMQPVSKYGRSKAEMERVIRTYQPQLPVTIVRPSAVYGPRDTDIYTFFKAINYGVCPIVGNPERPQISLVHARDLARGIIGAAHAPEAAGNTYFLSSERPYAWAEIKNAACHALDRSAITVPVPRRAVSWLGAAAEFAGRLTRTYPAFNREKAREILDACKMCSVDNAREDFDYHQQLSLDDGIANTTAWYEREDWL